MPPTGGIGGIGAFGALLLPILIISLMLRDKGPVGRFVKAGATSPTTARRPASLEIARADLLAGPIRRGILISTGDGRYWVDRGALRRYRLRLSVILVLLIASFFGALIYMVFFSAWRPLFLR